MTIEIHGGVLKSDEFSTLLNSCRETMEALSLTEPSSVSRKGSNPVTLHSVSDEFAHENERVFDDLKTRMCTASKGSLFVTSDSERKRMDLLSSGFRSVGCCVITCSDPRESHVALLMNPRSVISSEAPFQMNFVCQLKPSDECSKLFPSISHETSFLAVIPRRQTDGIKLDLDTAPTNDHFNSVECSVFISSGALYLWTHCDMTTLRESVPSLALQGCSFFRVTKADPIAILSMDKSGELSRSIGSMILKQSIEAQLQILADSKGSFTTNSEPSEADEAPVRGIDINAMRRAMIKVSQRSDSVNASSEQSASLSWQRLLEAIGRNNFTEQLSRLTSVKKNQKIISVWGAVADVATKES